MRETRRISARLRIAVLCLFVALDLCAEPSVSRASDLPPAIVAGYRAGTNDVHLDTDPVRIPLRGTDWNGAYASPYLRVFVNGKGPFTFLFDTGATVTILSGRFVRAANVRVASRETGHHEIVVMDELRAGGVRARNFYAVVDDGLEVDGILGFNAFGSNFLTFDLANHTMLVSSRVVPLSRAAWMPYRFGKPPLPLIDLKIDGKTLPTLIDTGDDAFAWEATTHDLRGILFDRPPVVAQTVYNNETGTTLTYASTVDGTLSLGPFSANRPAIGINDALPVPDIGCDVIEQFVIEFDRRARRVAFAPNFTGATFRVPGLLTLGFSMSFRHPTRIVSGVLPDRAAARLGMRRGDRIVTINDVPATGIGYRAWDELLRARRPISIEWSHHGRPSRYVFPVIELP